MDEQRDKAVRGWAKFLNPEVLRGNLIAASIFIAAYQTFRASVTDRVRDFFTNGFDESGWLVSDEYKTKVLVLDKSPLRASLLWLRAMSAIDTADMANADKVREHRNRLAHDLPKFLGTADAEIDLQLLGTLYELITKIDRWWIREVETTTDSDFDGRELADEDITSGNMLFLGLMLRIASGEDSVAYWEEFRNRVGDSPA